MFNKVLSLIQNLVQFTIQNLKNKTLCQFLFFLMIKVNIKGILIKHFKEILYYIDSIR